MNYINQISIQELLEGNKNRLLIDVRSPGEYQEFHIPGAINVPIFSNEERAKIGTLYKQNGPQKAKREGLKIVGPKLGEIYQRISSTSIGKDETLIYCARGGMRSKSIAQVMATMGLEVSQLEGGIRSFRQKITSDLEEAFTNKSKRFFVLEGLTGTRKTDILEILAERGEPVIDLEGMAGHRGSIFGSVGMNSNSQKSFECLLWERFRELKEASYYIIEAESKRIGRIVLPPFIIEGKENGDRFHIHYPFQKRVKAICETYKPEANKQGLYEAFSNLKKHLQKELRVELEVAFAEDDFSRIVSLLLEHYYDPKYSHKFNAYQKPAEPVYMETLQGGADHIYKRILEYMDGEDEESN